MNTSTIRLKNNKAFETELGYISMFVFPFKKQLVHEYNKVGIL